MFRRYHAPNITTVIGYGVDILGDLRFSDGLHVDGTIKGNISGDPQSKSTLILSDTGLIEGDVRVANAILNGTIAGDVHVSEKVELAAEARLTGTLYYQSLEMTMGAEVNGELIHLDDVETRMPSLDGGNDSGPDCAQIDGDVIRD